MTSEPYDLGADTLFTHIGPTYRVKEYIRRVYDCSERNVGLRRFPTMDIFRMCLVKSSKDVS